MEGVEADKTIHPKRKQRNQSEWKREKRKRSIIAGESHYSVKGEFVSRKEIGSDCNCKLKCYEKVDIKTRQMLFDGFYSLNSYDEQNAYLFGLIRKHDVKRKKNLQSDRRTCTYKYYVRNQGKEIQVCKLAFAHIHAVSFRKIRTLSEKLDQNILFPRDGRGKHDNRPKRVSQETTDLIKNHIFQIIKSNDLMSFMKEDKNRQMMAELNVAKLYVNFLQTYECEALNSLTGQPIPGYNPKVKSWLYRKVFHEEVKSKDFQTLKKRLDAFNDDALNKPVVQNSDKDSSSKHKVDKSSRKSRRKGTAKKLTIIDSGNFEDNLPIKCVETLQYQEKQSELGCPTGIHFPIVPNYNIQNTTQSIELQSHRSIPDSTKHHQPPINQSQGLQTMNPHQAHTESTLHHHSLQDFTNSHQHFMSIRSVKEPPVNRMTFLPHSINPQSIGAISHHHHAIPMFGGGNNDQITLQRFRNSSQGQHYGGVTGLMHTNSDANNHQLDLTAVGDMHAFYS